MSQVVAEDAIATIFFNESTFLIIYPSFVEIIEIPLVLEPYLDLLIYHSLGLYNYCSI